MLDKAAPFFLSLFTDQEDFKKFPKEFVHDLSMWARLWFLKDEPTLEPVLVAKVGYALKSEIVSLKVPKLMANEQFVKELTRRLVDYESMKNAIINSKLDIKGNANISDKNLNGKEDGKHGNKNVIADSTVTVGGDMHIGDRNEIIIKSEHIGSGDIVHGSKINNYYESIGQSPQSGEKANIKAKIKTLIGQGELDEAITLLVEYTEANNNRMHNDALQLSGRLHTLISKENRGLLSQNEILLEQNKIRVALLDLISRL